MSRKAPYFCRMERKADQETIKQETIKQESLAMALAEKAIYTEDEYFKFECRSFGRWEYVHGEIREEAPVLERFLIEV